MNPLDSVILTLNAGSSSLKFAAFRLANGGGPNLLASGQIEGIGATAKGAVETASGETAELSFDRSHAPVDHAAAMGAILDWLKTSGIQFFGRSGWPSHRARRPGLCRAGPDRRRDAREAQGAHSARAAPPAAQCRRRRSGDEGLPVDAASRVLRHRFPSQPSLPPTTHMLCRAPITTRACVAMAFTAFPTSSSLESCARSRRRSPART